MRKNLFYILLIIFALVVVYIMTKNDEKTFKIDGVKYAVSVNGEMVSSFPEKNSYDVTIECQNAEAYWNYEEWLMEIYNVTNNVLCNISFDTKDKENLNNYIISLTGTTQGTGEVVNENGYRYEGKNPNNYIKFNNEMWRIIGVFDSNSHGVTGVNLTKIIRNQSFGGYSYGKNIISNVWPNSNIYNLLNTYYYNATDGQDSGYCYQYYENSVTGHCDYTNIGIQNNYRSMVKNVTWYLGGYSSPSATAGNFFGYERSTSDNNYYDTDYKTTNGYIGLMYVSDYGYSTLASSCARTTTLDSYNTEACAGSSWIKKETDEWTMTSNSANSFAIFYIRNSGILYNIEYFDVYTTSNYYTVRPVLYLDSSVYIISGDGSESNPYIIAMD